MRDRSKQLLVINTGKKESEQTRLPAQSGTTHIIGGGGLSVNMSDYLLKSIWDKVFEIRTDSQGAEYIFGKLPMVTQYGITMYSGDGVDIPSLASGLPFDGRTIWYNPDTNQIEVIGGTGGGSGEGVSNFWDLSGIPSWITISKPKYTYSEIEGTPDLSGFATQNWIISQGYASAEELKKYIPISGYTEVSGEKNFTGGLKVNGSPIYYDTEKKYWKLEGDLLVTGGVTMYGSDSSFVPSTIMDALLYDDTTLGINSNGQLYVKGGAGGGINTTDLQNYLTSNSYLNVTGGDNRYLKLSGGTIKNGSARNPFIIDTDSSVGAYLVCKAAGVNKAYFGYDSSLGALMQVNEASSNTILYITNNQAYVSNGATKSKLWNEGNDGGGSGLDADLLDGQQGSWYQQNVLGFARYNYTSNTASEHDANAVTDGMLYNYSSPNYWKNAPSGLSYGQILSLSSANNTALMGQLAWDINHNSTSDTTNTLWWRGIQGKDRMSYAKWHQIAFTDSNVESATKLQTTRTIWGQSFDGSGNVDGNMIVKGQYVGITLQGTNSYNTGITFNDYEGNPRWDLSYRGLNAADKDFYIYRYTDDNSYHVAMSLIRSNGNVGIDTPSPQYKLDVEGTIRCYSILPKSADSYKIGDWGNYYQMANVNVVYCGANYNNLWLVGGKNANEIGVVIGRNTINDTSNAEICRFNANGLVWAKGVKGDIRTVDTAIELIKNNTDSNAVYLGDGTFSPFLASSDLLSLGISSKRWNGVYLGTDTSAINTRGVVFCNSSSNQLALIGANNSGDCGIYSRSSIVLRPGGDSNSDGTIAPKAIGVTISANGDLLVTGGITMYSDKRKKTILNRVELSLKQIADAPLIEHYYNSDDKKTTHVGSIAQYWASMNDWFCKLDSEGYYTMEIQNAALASAISIARELDRYETKTDKAIKKLKKRICELEEEVERLKSA